MQKFSATIDFGLLNRLSRLLLCGRCLRKGVTTPVPQVVSHRHRPRSLCRECRAEVGPKPRRMPAPILLF